MNVGLIFMYIFNLFNIGGRGRQRASLSPNHQKETGTQLHFCSTVKHKRRHFDVF